MHGEIGESERCVACGYDLKGLTPDGVCPECAAPIGRSVPACPRCAREGKTLPLRRRRSRGGPGASWGCDACHGLGFERHELRRAAASFARPVRRAEQVFDLTRSLTVSCTRCSAPMASIVLDARTLIDRCGACGLIWVDGGELAAVAEYVRRHLGDARPPANFEEILGRPELIRPHAERAERRADTGEALVEGGWWLALLLSILDA